ncbi:hypothetical protein J3R83DRAFT_1672 [Lanmaoa asiatica]|nr:hypothetical protein J3R83DRAFT_1672 [Lanmaoa asiatica]
MSDAVPKDPAPVDSLATALNEATISSPDGVASVPSTAPAIKPTDTSMAHEQVVTPWDVQGSVSADGKQLAIDYDKLIDQFGTRRVDAALLERFEKLTGHKPHPLLRRGMFFSHRSVSLTPGV